MCQPSAMGLLSRGKSSSSAATGPTKSDVESGRQAEVSRDTPEAYDEDLQAIRMRLSSAISAMDGEVNKLDKAPLHAMLGGGSAVADKSKGSRPSPPSKPRSLNALAPSISSLLTRFPMWVRVVAMCAVLTLLKVSAATDRGGL